MELAQLVKSVESRQEVVDAARVLAKLEERGLREPAIASGWVRSFIAGTPRSDIDISYVGDVPHDEARRYLSGIIDELNLDASLWDINGIWNIQHQYPRITRTELNFKYLYVSSIDAVYLASDGKLHDTMGTGLADAQQRILRMNDFESFDFPYPDVEIAYLGMEGCRRIARFDWTPARRSVELIRESAQRWALLSEGEKDSLLQKRILGKYSPEEYAAAQAVYEQYGWGFLFDAVQFRFSRKGRKLYK